MVTYFTKIYANMGFIDKNLSRSYLDLTVSMTGEQQTHQSKKGKEEGWGDGG